MIFRIISVFFLIVVSTSCSSSPEKEDIEDTNDTINCTTTDINITELDSIVIHNSNPSIWKGSFSDNEIKIQFTTIIGVDDETENYTFILSKVNNCLKKERAYKFYDGKLVDVSAVTEMDILEFYVKDWEVNTYFSGLIVFRDPHNKRLYSKKIWIDNFDAEEVTSQNLVFDDCLGVKLPIEIDVDEDNITDFILGFEESRNIGNTPKFNTYTLKLISTSTKNKILSPIKNTEPYTIVFQPPFSSENTKQYFGGVKSELDIFYEYDTPYENYNYFLSNNLTYRGILQNNTPDYFVISKEIDGKEHYGWIKFELDTSNCVASVLFAYLNSNPETHVQIR
ncbi:hypothetical protein [Polaribacter porphyrae]|uniref:Uncharacterized protein n=1 Tax=Polaribacter porphyrae TaxID=1137780 RepID=A0A2S7WJC2_9FLAO|nr:hypothetical protein [Polaribacter porphyrae]PQJ77708.1 hypothetical protein BTO18_00255 [Polaribacter porphyrae]